LESGQLTEDEPASSTQSGSEQLDTKTPTITKRSTHLTEKPKDGRDIGDDNEEQEDDDGSTEEEEDDEEESEDDDDEEEPVLKYERLGKAAAEILEKDTASAIAVSETYFVSPYYRLSLL